MTDAILVGPVFRNGLRPGDWRSGKRIEVEQEEDGRWIAEIPELAGVMTYGESRAEAISKVKALALRAMADQQLSGTEFHK